jgi:hypothetical protein
MEHQCCAGCNVVSELDQDNIPGAAHLVLARGVAHLDPASAVFEAMLEGWATQQRARFLKGNMIGPRLELVRRFAAFTNQYPWRWAPAEAEAFITHSPVAVRCQLCTSRPARTRSGCDQQRTAAKITDTGARAGDGRQL